MKALDKVYRELFPTPMFMARVDDLSVCDRAVEDLKKLRATGVGFPNDFSWSSPDYLHTLPEFRELAEFFHFEAGEVLEAMGIKRDSHEITCMWANAAELGYQHMMHVHANSVISGILYLEAPEGSGDTIFMDPRPAPMMFEWDYFRKDAFEASSKYISNKAEKGVLTFFPSWLAHGVGIGAKRPGQERIVMSFNVMIRGELTQETKKLAL
jgi:uncharacterized protein (TIGR02466 family)